MLPLEVTVSDFPDLVPYSGRPHACPSSKGNRVSEVRVEIAIKRGIVLLWAGAMASA